MSTSAQKWDVREPLPPLIPREHEDFGKLQIPWYDEQLGLAQGLSHKDVIFQIGDCLRRLAELAGLGFLADNPFWYWDKEKQKTFNADLAIADTLKLKSITAQQLLLACEVVPTTNKAKLYKDTHTSRFRNEEHGVPEFLLLYPRLDDARILEWYTLINGSYHLIQAHDGHYASRAIPGLVIKSLKKEMWKPGRKCMLIYKDVPLMSSEDEHAARLVSEERAHKAEGLMNAAVELANTQKEIADQAVAQAKRAFIEKEYERSEKERLLAIVKEMGVDPNTFGK